MFMGPLEKSKPWNTKGLQGCYRFLQKVWKLFHNENTKILEDCCDDETKRILHQTIKKVSDNLNDLKFNTVVSQLMILTNHLSNLENLDKKVLQNFLILLNPFAPHIAEELNEKLGYGEITKLNWPDYDSNLILEDKTIIAVQFNGKKRGTVEIALDMDQSSVLELVKKTPFGEKYLAQAEIRKIIYIPNKIINILLG